MKTTSTAAGARLAGDSAKWFGENLDGLDRSFLPDTSSLKAEIIVPKENNHCKWRSEGVERPESCPNCGSRVIFLIKESKYENH